MKKWERGRERDRRSAGITVVIKITIHCVPSAALHFIIALRCKSSLKVERDYEPKDANTFDTFTVDTCVCGQKNSKFLKTREKLTFLLAEKSSGDSIILSSVHVYSP